MAGQRMARREEVGWDGAAVGVRVQSCV
ncbi:hypothetical protein E2C01_060947 [Portunus trituberculatus]|uniref:Uncharacterized protein n=1 Tax=Portunus trituberculatus TaxID=210409 RepID=A0A5B7HDR0_PORTR|nr:hypothetical protein [Portunus trituberculatus]